MRAVTVLLLASACAVDYLQGNPRAAARAKAVALVDAIGSASALPDPDVLRTTALDWAAIDEADDETAIALLTQLPGVGRWTAEMLLIFQLDRLDIFAVGDLGLRRAVESLYRKGKPISALGLKRITNRWRPVRSVASWYLWRHVDPETQTW